MTEQVKHDSVKGKGFVISSANIVDGKLDNVVFKGDPLNMLDMAQALVKSSLLAMAPVQRPLQRKFDSMIEKLTALQDDVDQEHKNREQREQARQERNLEKMYDELGKLGGKA